jgi:FkbM family methyltransferase
MNGLVQFSMLISIPELISRWAVKPQGVLHVGAHMAEESKSYNAHNWGHVYWVEAQPDLAFALAENLDPKTNTVIQAVAWSESGITLNFNIASNGQSSSILELGTHAESYPEITYINRIKVQTSRLDEVLPEEVFCDFLTLDVQGSELEVLIGLGQYIKQFKWIYTEINLEEVYKGCATSKELDSFLSNFGFLRVQTRWVAYKGWGDALYIHSSLKPAKSLIVTMRMKEHFGLALGKLKSFVKRALR